MKYHPMQEIVEVSGVVRFRQNAIINWLFESGRLDLNYIAHMNFTQEDRIQLAQLLGYSVGGFQGLSYVDENSKHLAEIKCENPEADDRDALIKILEERLQNVKDGLRETVAQLYDISPDDLT